MKRYAASLFLGVGAALALTLSVAAQSGGFEVASVKPSNPNPAGPLGLRRWCSLRSDG